MKKTLGKVNIHRHLIGDRKPIVIFLGLGAVATLTGCDTKEDAYYAFTNMGTCEKQLPGQCEAAYKLAEKEAKRTALKYMVESECSRDFGLNICLQDDQGAWYPKMAGFITHKDESVDFTQPFFTTFNHTQSLYGKAFMANGREITDLRDMNGLNLYLGGSYAKPLPDSMLDGSSISEAPTSGQSNNVADAPTEGWFLASETCGGFGCYQKNAAIRVLEIQPRMMALLQHIVDEEWYEDSLDYEGMCLPSSEAVKAYNAELAKVGLNFSAEESCAVLSQALYPIDPTLDNIKLLSSTEIDMNQIDPLNECDLVLYIVGDNCD